MRFHDIKQGCPALTKSNSSYCKLVGAQHVSNSQQKANEILRYLHATNVDVGRIKQDAVP
jgi:hypothetical protein